MHCLWPGSGIELPGTLSTMPHQRLPARHVAFACTLLQSNEHNELKPSEFQDSSKVGSFSRCLFQRTELAKPAIASLHRAITVKISMAISFACNACVVTASAAHAGNNQVVGCLPALQHTHQHLHAPAQPACRLMEQEVFSNLR